MGRRLLGIRRRSRSRLRNLHVSLIAATSPKESTTVAAVAERRASHWLGGVDTARCGIESGHLQLATTRRDALIVLSSCALELIAIGPLDMVPDLSGAAVLGIWLEEVS